MYHLTATTDFDWRHPPECPDSLPYRRKVLPTPFVLGVDVVVWREWTVRDTPRRRDAHPEEP